MSRLKTPCSNSLKTNDYTPIDIQGLQLKSNNLSRAAMNPANNQGRQASKSFRNTKIGSSSGPSNAQTSQITRNKVISSGIKTGSFGGNTSINLISANKLQQR